MDDAIANPLPQNEVDYFDKQFNGSNAEYWRRVGDVDFQGKNVLDVGCGHGALSLYAAQQGATRVVGVDIDSERINFARRNIERNHPLYGSSISFHCGELEEIAELFDLAVSKDSFEHIDDLATMMESIKARLKDGGLLITGFSPLYFSPFGDHGRYWRGPFKLPWLPVLLPERLLFRVASQRRNERIASARDVGLNKLTASEFLGIVAAQGWEVVTFQTNRGARAGMRIMTALSKLAPLEKYFTVSVYAQLRKPGQ